MSQITTLIDGPDTFEVIRDKIAQILADESANQVALATTAGKPNPQEWALKVYTERATPWDNGKDDEVIVNVWYDTASIDESASNTVQSQTMRGTFNIDVIGFATSKADGAGQKPGDEGAARVAQRGLRLVRNIIMSSFYTYLDLRGVVGQRMPQSITSFQPQLNDQAYLNAVGSRFALAVRYEETSPQYQPIPLQELAIEVQIAEDGRVLAEVEYKFTP
ncbi:hypothetical protein [Shewanella phage SFCi1]|nr:hypothetical protein [Shewanella phage SFCi1]